MTARPSRADLVALSGHDLLSDAAEDLVEVRQVCVAEMGPTDGPGC